MKADPYIGAASANYEGVKSANFDFGRAAIEIDPRFYHFCIDSDCTKGIHMCIICYSLITGYTIHKSDDRTQILFKSINQTSNYNYQAANNRLQPNITYHFHFQMQNRLLSHNPVVHPL